MNKDRLLSVLVASDVLLAFGTIGAELMFHWTLPDSLSEYAWSSLFSMSSPWDAFLFLLWSGTILCTLVAWIGLLNYWWFARRVYLVAWSSWILVVLLSGPSVMTSVGAVITTLSAMTGGAILGLVYFSDLARHFERPAQDAALAAGHPGRV